MCVCACVQLQTPEPPFYCSFDPHPKRHEGQGGALIQVLGASAKPKGDKKEKKKCVETCEKE